MLSRNILPAVKAALADTPVVLLHGARQVGKTTLVHAIANGRPRREYKSLDEGSELSAALADPEGYLCGLANPVVLDEVQRAPELFRTIKAAVDRNRTAGRYLLTGSANIMLMPRLSESLAGRIEVITLWPFSQGEIEGTVETFLDKVFSASRLRWQAPAGKSRPLIERIVRGGFPEPMTRSDVSRRRAWYASYLETTLRRDIRDLANFDSLLDLPRLLSLISHRTSGLLNFADLSRGVAIPQTTLKRYFTLLHASFLVVTLPAWTTNRGLRQTKASKIFISDTGLAAHLLGADSNTIRTDGRVRGMLLENFVTMELLKQIGWSKTRPSAHHFRSASGQEVDIVLEDQAGRIVGIEVKSSKSVTADDFRGLRALREIAGKKFLRGIVLHDGDATVHFDQQFLSAPIAALWSDFIHPNIT
jgi:predicted AAA+ superfamily ATPase